MTSINRARMLVLAAAIVFSRDALGFGGGDAHQKAMVQSAAGVNVATTNWRTELNHQADVTFDGLHRDGCRRQTLPCDTVRASDKFGARNFYVWSAVIGVRWPDRMGFTRSDCQEHVAQRGEEYQPDHFLRQSENYSGSAGYWAAVANSRKRFEEYLSTAIRADYRTRILVTDGGKSQRVFGVSYKFFMFGRAAHILLDSFNTTHVGRKFSGGEIFHVATKVCWPDADAVKYNDRRWNSPPVTGKSEIEPFFEMSALKKLWEVMMSMSTYAKTLQSIPDPRAQQTLSQVLSKTISGWANEFFRFDPGQYYRPTRNCIKNLSWEKTRNWCLAKLRMATRGMSDVPYAWKEEPGWQKFKSFVHEWFYKLPSEVIQLAGRAKDRAIDYLTNVFQELIRKGIAKTDCGKIVEIIYRAFTTVTTGFTREVATRRWPFIQKMDQCAQMVLDGFICSAFGLPGDLFRLAREIAQKVIENPVVCGGAGLIAGLATTPVGGAIALAGCGLTYLIAEKAPPILSCLGDIWKKGQLKDYLSQLVAEQMCKEIGKTIFLVASTVLAPHSAVWRLLQTLAAYFAVAKTGSEFVKKFRDIKVDQISNLAKGGPCDALMK